MQCANYLAVLAATAISVGQLAALAYADRSASIITVDLAFVEALDPADTTSSKRFQTEYESAITTGRELTAKQLLSCGFQLRTKTAFYAASDPLQAKETADKSRRSGAWMIIGPRRSNHYILLAKGSEGMPTVSLMASSEEVAKLGKMHLSLAPTNAQLAKVAAAEAFGRLKDDQAGTYVSIIAADCMACLDFASSFDAAAQTLSKQKLAEFKVIGDQPDLRSVIRQIKANNPSIVLLPNYSVLTSYLIYSIHPHVPKAIFVGGDGWGNSSFGFVQNGRALGDANGLTVRGNPSISHGLETFPLGAMIRKRGLSEKFGSSAALAILKAIDSAAQFLCDTRPKDAVTFTSQFRMAGQKYFSSPWGVSVYNLEKGNIVFSSTKDVL